METTLKLTAYNPLHTSGLFFVLIIDEQLNILYRNLLTDKLFPETSVINFGNYISASEKQLLKKLLITAGSKKNNQKCPAIDVYLNKLNITFEITINDNYTDLQTHFQLTGTSVSPSKILHKRSSILEEFLVYINSIKDYIVVFDHSQTVLFVNKAFTDFTNNTFENVKNKPLLTIFPDKLKTFKKFIQLKLSEQKNRDYKYADKVTGAIYIISFTESINGTILLIRDITHAENNIADLEKTKHALELRDERFKILLSNSIDIVLVADDKAVLKFAGYPVLKILGYLPEEMEGKSGFDFIHPDDVHLVMEAFSKVLQNDESLSSFDVRIRHKDNSWRWMEIMGVNLFDEPLINGILINLNEIGVRKKAEIALADSNEMLTMIFESNLDGIMLSNSKDEIIKVNNSLCKLLECEQNEIIKYKRSDILGKGSLDKSTTGITNFTFLTSTITNKKGKKIPVEISAIKLLQANGDYLINSFIKDRREFLKAETLKELSLSVSNELNKYQFLQKSLLEVLAKIRNYIQWDLIELWVPDYSNTKIDLIAYDFVTDKENIRYFFDYSRKNDFTFTNYGTGPAYITKKTYWIEDIKQDNTIVRKKIALACGLKSAIVFPIINEEKIIGLLYLFNTETKKKDDTIINQFEIICNQIGAELAKREKEKELDYFFASNNDIMVIVGKDGYFKKINKAATTILGYSAEELCSIPASSFIHPDDKNLSANRFKKLTNGINLKEKAYRYITKDNRVKWLEWNSSFMKREQIIIATARDITKQRKQQQILNLEKNILFLQSKTESDLKVLLTKYLLEIENVFEGSLCSILGLTDINKTVYTLAAPSLPEGYVQLINGISIGPAAGSCGTAMYHKKTVIVSSIEKDPLWKDFKNAALPYELRACWSVPIIAPNKKVIASFAIYYKEEKIPELFEVEIIEYCANFLSILIENIQSKENLRISNEMYKLATKATNEVIRDMDLSTNSLQWSDGFYQTLGYKINGQNKEIEFWKSCIHPKDRKRINLSFSKFISSNKYTKWQEEYRFKKADGTYAYIIDKCYLLYDRGKKAYRMIGAMLDITDMKLLEQELLQQELKKQNEIAKAVLETQETERTNIGKELHDNINQLLTITKLYIELAKTDIVNFENYLQRSANNISESIHLISTISKSLIPSGIDDLGLKIAVKDLIESIQILNNINIEFYPIGNFEKINDKNLELTIYRIIQEQLNNIIKHAACKNVIVELTKHSKFIELNIEDDGKGFVLSKIKRGLGLNNIQSRTLLYNGTSQFITSPGKGCKLKVTIPLVKTIKPSNK